MPDLGFELVEGSFFHPGEPVATSYWKGAGTFTGPFDPPGFAPTGTRLEIDGFDLQEYRDSLVCRLRVATDMLEASRQLGLMPQQGSRAEKAGAVAQRAGRDGERPPAARRPGRGRVGPRRPASPPGTIELVRDISRLVTRRLGALDDPYLGKRPLGECRVLYEIGVEGATARDVRARLGLEAATRRA